jgi:hypothetical protein
VLKDLVQVQVKSLAERQRSGHSHFSFIQVTASTFNLIQVTVSTISLTQVTVSTVSLIQVTVSTVSLIQVTDSTVSLTLVTVSTVSLILILIHTDILVNQIATAIPSPILVLPATVIPVSTVNFSLIHVHIFNINFSLIFDVPVTVFTISLIQYNNGQRSGPAEGLTKGLVKNQVQVVLDHLGDHLYAKDFALIGGFVVCLASLSNLVLPATATVSLILSHFTVARNLNLTSKAQIQCLKRSISSNGQDTSTSTHELRKTHLQCCIFLPNFRCILEIY